MKRFLLISMCVALSMLMPLSSWAQEAYSVVKNGTITFYYDNNKSTRDGQVYNLAKEYVGDGNFPAWKNGDFSTVRFDSSFGGYSPTSTARWFHSCAGITSIEGLENLNTSAVTNMSSMFYGCSSLIKIDLSGFNTSSVASMSTMFYGCAKLESLDLSSFDTKNVTNLVAMFYGCSALKDINVSSFNTKNVDDLEYLFFGCSQLQKLYVTNFNTSKVTNMEALFANCSSLKELDLSSFTTNNVTNIQMLFSDCTSLQTIYVSEGWSTENVTSGLWVFDNCPKLVGGEGTACATSFITSYLYAKIDEYVSPGYFTYKSYDPNGINSIIAEKGIRNGSYYSIDGKRIEIPRKGLVINNGKKYIIR